MMVRRGCMVEEKTTECPNITGINRGKFLNTSKITSNNTEKTVTAPKMQKNIELIGETFTSLLHVWTNL